MQSLLLLFLLIFQNLPILPLATTNNFIEAPYFQNSPQCKPTNHNTIHIAMTLDEAYLRGSMAAVLSIVHHSDCPHNIFFHFIHSKNRSEELKNTMSSSFSYLRFEMYPFDEGVVKDRISVSLRKALDRPLNYARSYLARLLPEGVKRVIYLDSDVIVVDNVEKLWVKKFVDGDSAIAAPEYCDADLARYFTQEFWSDKRMSSILRKRKRKPCYFNTGVMVVDLHKWRRNDYTKAIERWMEVQKRRRIYELGSLPPFLLVFAGRVTAVEARWNQHGLGGDNYVGHCRGLHPGEASLLHWSGRGKPWVRLDEGRPCPVDALWAPYDMIKKPFHSLDH